MKESTVNYRVEYFSENFEKYAAAVKMAELASKGSGELNQFDHVAKDLHKEGFDSLYDKLPDWRKRAFFAEHEEEIKRMANEKYPIDELVF